jgi:hypothetical protein
MSLMYTPQALHNPEDSAARLPLRPRCFQRKARDTRARMMSVLSEVLPVPARDEPLLLNLAASNSSSSSSSSSSGGGGGGGKRKRKKKIGTLEELLEEHPESSRRFSSTPPSRSCPEAQGQGPPQRPLQWQTKKAHRQGAGAKHEKQARRLAPLPARAGTGE